MLLATTCVSIVKVNRQMSDCVLRTLNKTNGVVSSFHTKYVEILYGLMSWDCEGLSLHVLLLLRTMSWLHVLTVLI